MFTLTPSPTTAPSSNKTKPAQNENYPHPSEKASTANIPSPQTENRTEKERQELGLRLENLLNCILTIIRGYSNLPHSSHVYLSSLYIFRKRTEDLLFFLKQNHRVSSHDEVESPCTSGDIWQYHESSDINPEAELDFDFQIEITKLENDWWNSEVVASWYGPRPRLGGPRPRTRSQVKAYNESCGVEYSIDETVKEGQQVQCHPRFRTSSLNLQNRPVRKVNMPIELRLRQRPLSASCKDLQALREEEEENDSTSQVELSDNHSNIPRARTSIQCYTQPAGQGQGQGQMAFLENVGKLKRDSSYVGLNDE